MEPIAELAASTLPARNANWALDVNASLLRPHPCAFSSRFSTITLSFAADTPAEASNQDTSNRRNSIPATSFRLNRLMHPSVGRPTGEVNLQLCERRRPVCLRAYRARRDRVKASACSTWYDRFVAAGTTAPGREPPSARSRQSRIFPKAGLRG